MVLMLQGFTWRARDRRKIMGVKILEEIWWVVLVGNGILA